VLDLKEQLSEEVVAALAAAEEFAAGVLDGAYDPVDAKDIVEEATHILQSHGYRKANRGGWITLDARIVTLDETRHWNLEPQNMVYVERIETMYVYDANEVTYCCETTPSYCLYPIDTRVLFRDGILVPAHVQNKLDEQIDYWKELDKVEYVHCHTIDAMAARPEEEFRYRKMGPVCVDFNEMPYQDQIEALIEHYQCNHPL
jgi:hypothetical protein